MNQNELKNAGKVARVAQGSIDCPVCFSVFEIKSSVDFQLVCPTCLLRVTIIVDEGASRIFDKQRQVEKKNLGQRREHIVIKPIDELPEPKKLRWTEDKQKEERKRIGLDQDVDRIIKGFKNAGKEQKSKRKPQRTQKQKASRKLGMQSLKERRKSRGV